MIPWWSPLMAAAIILLVGILADVASKVHQSRNRIPRRWWRP